MLTKSLAGTDRNYVLLQAREKEGKWHVQGKGISVNRDYGVAADIEDLHSDGCFLRNRKSLAGTGKKYFEVRAVLNGSTLHFQAPTDQPDHNRDYGMALDIPASKAPDLAKFVKRELEGVTVKPDAEPKKPDFTTELAGIAKRLHEIAKAL